MHYHVISFLDTASTTKYSSRAANALYAAAGVSPTAFAAYHQLLYAAAARRGLGRPDRGPAGAARPAGRRRRGRRPDPRRDVRGVRRPGPPTSPRRTASPGRPTVLVNGKTVEPADPGPGHRGGQRRLLTPARPARRPWPGRPGRPSARAGGALRVGGCRPGRGVGPRCWSARARAAAHERIAPAAFADPTALPMLRPDERRPVEQVRAGSTPAGRRRPGRVRDGPGQRRGGGAAHRRDRRGRAGRDRPRRW